MEIWKEIDDYSNYLVSDKGRVLSLRSGKILGFKPTYQNGVLVALRAGLYKNGKQRFFRVSRLVATAFIPNDCDKPVVDHINHDVSDNSCANLRWATYKENTRNQRITGRGSSRFKGVDKTHSCKNSCLWRARIKLDGKRVFLGHYFSEEDAARAYDNAARANFGDYACLNFPDE